jgi:hypothetical protein
VRHNNHHHHHHHHHKTKYRTYGAFFANKSVQLFYFWARTRVVQRAIICLSLIWIVLIFYKSLLIVELMRHDVNVRKEHVEALLPRGIGLPRLFKDNFNQIMFTSSPPSTAASTVQTDLPATSSSPSSTAAAAAFIVSTTTAVDYLRQHFDNLFVAKTKLTENGVRSIAAAAITTPSSYHLATGAEDDQSWKMLSYNHWLTLFSYYNVSLYNRYVAILPPISLWRAVSPAEVARHRCAAEVAKYSAVVDVDETPGGRFVINATTMHCGSESEGVAGPAGGFQNERVVNEPDDFTGQSGDDVISYRNALFELLGIVVLGN